MGTLEVIDAFLEHIGRKRVSGTSCEPVFALIVMDRVFQIYDTKVRKSPYCKFRCKVFAKGWRKSYNALNEIFFGAFNVDQSVFVTDMMDRFESYICENETEIYNAIYACCSCVPEKKRELAVFVILANIWSKVSQVIWKKVYGAENGYISDIIGYTWDFVDEYCKGCGFDLNSCQPLSSGVTNLCHKTVQFIKLDYDREIQENSLKK